jgi:RNA polymerase sigma factor (TIGR02999 family)
MSTAGPFTPRHLEFRRLLDEASGGSQEALARLMPLVYEELRRMASGYLRRERRGHTLQTTALVHEAYLRLVGQDDLSFENRAHFRAIAARTMRRILVEHARARGAAKRGGSRKRVTLEDTLALAPSPRLDLQALDEALERLAALDAQQARIVELRFFAGLTVEETAEAVGLSPATIKREWAMARAWLRRELARGRSAP